jgi:endonuclease/exonuclease/phosphatase family metal-dependent hydrolase
MIPPLPGILRYSRHPDRVRHHMKRFAIRLICLCAAMIVAAAASESPLRVLCWNMHRGIGTDGKTDLERVAKIISNHNPDVVLLQEVDNQCRRSGNVNQAAELARLTELHHTFGKAMDHDGGEYGLAILSRYPLSDVQIHPLPGSGEPRIALSALVDSPLGIISLATIHLDFKDQAEQLAQAQVAAAQLLKSPHPVILGGDFNAEPDSKTLAVFAQAPWSLVQKKQPASTAPAGQPDKEIDHLILRGLIAHRPAVVINEPVASDHRPVIAVITK